MQTLGPYQIDNIYAGDCAEMLKAVPDCSIDLTVTSPPYDNLREYNGYTFNFEAIAAQLWRVTKTGGVVVWVVADETEDGSESGTSFTQALHFKSLGFNFETMIYEVAGTGAKGSNRLYWQSFEYMFVLSKGKMNTVNLIRDKKNIYAGSIKNKSIGGRSEKYGKRSSGTFTIQEYGIRTNIWRYGSRNTTDDKTDHTAPFPEALVRDHILSWSNAGDIVLDPMCGSGTTCKQAKMLERHYIGFDVSAEYVEDARQRVNNAPVPLPFYSGTQQSFAADH
jgi:DNA modification methylase